MTTALTPPLVRLKSVAYLVVTGCVLFGLPLAAYAYAGTFSRYFADDYCAGYIFQDYGLLGGQKWFYMNWGAVPATLLLMAITEPAGARLTPVLPALAILSWVASATWAIRALSARLRERLDLPTSLLLASVLVFVTIADTPNVIQSVYMRIPLFEYVGPLIVASAYVGFLLRAAQPSPDPARFHSLPMAASAAITFAAGNLGPSYAAVQTTAMILAWILARMARTRENRAVALDRLLLAGMIGSFAALAFIAVAPGNAARQLRYPSPPGLLAIVEWSVLSTGFMFARPILPVIRPAIEALAPALLGSTPMWLGKALEMSTSPLTMILAVGVPAWIALTKVRLKAAPTYVRADPTYGLVGAPIVAFILVMACMAPSVYGTSAPPPPRTLIVPGFVMTAAAMIWGYALGIWIRRRRVSPERLLPVRLAGAVLVVIAVWSTMTVTTETIRRGAALRAWAARWDDMDRRLREAGQRGERHVTMPLVESVGGVVSFAAQPSDWVNSCAAQYYGLETITGAALR